MVKRRRILVIGLVVVLAFSSLAVAYYWYRGTQIDTSWVEGLNQLVQNATPYPTNYSNPNVLLSPCTVYLIENGTGKLIQYDLGKDTPISTYLNNLLIKANLQLQPSGSFSSEFLDRVLASDIVVKITYRQSVMMFGGQQRFGVGYFVLKDNLNEGLVGKIIVGEVQKQGFSLWAISK